MPRLFSGLDIPSGVSQRLTMMRGGLPGARWIDEENYHLTLRFIGDIDDALAQDIAHELDRIDRPPFRVCLDGLTTFGGNRPRAIIARAQPTPQLLALQAEHERAVRRAGAPAEPRKFVPHVTLARLRASNVMAVADYLSSCGLFEPQSFEVDRFVLYSSRASTGGGPYIVEETYPLGSANAQSEDDENWQASY